MKGFFFVDMKQKHPLYNSQSQNDGGQSVLSVPVFLLRPCIWINVFIVAFEGLEDVVYVAYACKTGEVNTT